MFTSSGGRLAAADRIVRFVLGVVLFLWGPFAGLSPWAIAIVAAIGGSLVTESAINYCPVARLLPWNRTRAAA